MRVRTATAIAISVLLIGACADTSSEGGPNVSSERTPAPTNEGDEKRTPKEPRGERSSPPEDPAPEFAFTTFDGDTFRLSEHKGTPVVLNFWESW